MQPVPQKRTLKSLLKFFLSGIFLIILSLCIGITDNTVGILVCMGGIISLFLAFTYHWQWMKSYVLLLIVSVLVFFLSVVLHNAFAAGGQYFHANGIISSLFNGLGVAFFLLVVFICPAAVFIGFFGLLKLTFFPSPKLNK